MGQTSKFKLPWPEMNQPSDGPGGYKRLAEATEAALVQVANAPGVMRYRRDEYEMASGSNAIPVTLDMSSYVSGTWTWPVRGHPVIPLTGRWLMISMIQFEYHPTGTRCATMTVNDGAMTGGGQVLPISAGHTTVVNVTAARRLTKGQTIGLYGWQNSGVKLTIIEAHLSLNWLGE